jgi:hypothetical protein
MLIKLQETLMIQQNKELRHKINIIRQENVNLRNKVQMLNITFLKQLSECLLA